MRNCRFSKVVFAATVCVLIAFGAAAEEGRSALEDARVQGIVVMAQGGLSVDVIMAKIEDIGAFPELSGGDLVALKEEGVPERALVRIIQLEESVPETSLPPSPEPPPIATPAEPPPTPEAETAFIRVEVARPFMITHLEVSIDDEILAERGKLWEGVSDPGQKLRRPSKIGRRKDTVITALETEVEAGSHGVSVGFAVTWVEDDSEQMDEWDEFSRESYINRGVRAEGETTEFPGEWGHTSLVNCEVEAGQTCVVTAELEKNAPTVFGGIPIYSVSYSVEIE